MLQAELAHYGANVLGGVVVLMLQAELAHCGANAPGGASPPRG